MQTIVFTDLDGTLLDRDTYSFSPAEPALQYLDQHRIPLVLSSSKTRCEMEMWRRRLGNCDPFIVENGAAVVIPQGYFPFPIPWAKSRGPFQVVEFGAPYAALVQALVIASSESRCRIAAFHQWDAVQLSLHTGLPLAEAELAKQREYDEPFEVADADQSRLPDLLAAIVRLGYRWTRGGRFYHITGNNDKAVAVRLLTELYQRQFGAVRTVGLGDEMNDVALLNTVDVPVVVHSAAAHRVAPLVRAACVTSSDGPQGWNEAVLAL